MPVPTSFVLEQTFEWTTQILLGGVPTDADGDVSFSIYEDGTDTAIATGTMSKLDDDNTTGLYRGSVEATAANGYEQYKTYNVHMTSVVNTISTATVGSSLALGGSDTIQATSGALTTLANYKTYAGITASTDDDLISALITRSTSAIQKFTSRDLIETTYREIRDWDGSSDVLTDQYPIINVTLLSNSRLAAFSIKNTATDSYNSFVSITDTSMILTIQGGGNAGTSTLTLSDSATLTALQTAITALGTNWEMTTPTTDVAKWSPTEILPVAGLMTQDNFADVDIPGTPDSQFVIDYDEGMISGATSGFHSGHDSYGTDYGFGRSRSGRQNLIIKYSAGFATTPADLEQICIDLTKVYFDSRTRDDGLESEKIGDYAYKVGDIMSGKMPDSIKLRLSSYVRRAL